MTTPFTTLIKDEAVYTPLNQTGIDLTTEAEPILPVNLNAIGYEKAEKHWGNALALENLLHRVLRGYLMDERNGGNGSKNVECGILPDSLRRDSTGQWFFQNFCLNFPGLSLGRGHPCTLFDRSALLQFRIKDPLAIVAPFKLSQ